MGTARTHGLVGDDPHPVTPERRVMVADTYRLDAVSVQLERIVGKRALCRYCGWPCYGRACAAHSDLLRLDVKGSAR